MKNNDFYHLPKAGKFTRFLWDCAGGDRFLLERATYSDQVKYMCLGGIVLATGVMASLAGGYAFYTIFAPKGDAIDEISSVSSVISSIVFGLIWGLIIFNIDRFIVASTGKGDGTEKITRDELISAIPRIIMGVIIAITISKPIEIRMFQTEINNKLYEEQLKVQKEYEIKTRKNFEDRLKDLGNENNEVQNKIDNYIFKINVKDSLYNVEMTEGNGGRGEGEGPVALSLKQERDRLKKEMDNFILNNKYKIDDIEKRRKSLNQELELALSQNKKVSSGLDGLLERIKLSHEIAGFWITLFITLLFMSIELTPVFFKLMLIKSPYDYIKDNYDDLIKTHHGIEVRYDYYKDKEGLERHLVIHHDAQNQMFEKLKISRIQKELTEYALELYKQREKVKINENLDDYIQKMS